MAQASGDPVTVRECNARIKRYKDKYAEISDITGIAQDKKRMTLTGAPKSDIINKKDIAIHKSVGASGKNYPVKLPGGNHTKLAEGTKITKVKAFAGNGTNTPIKEAVFLENNYGISADKWQKVRGEGVVLDNGKKTKSRVALVRSK